MDRLPDELLLFIFQNVDKSTLIYVLFDVCQRFLRLAVDQSLWKSQASKDHVAVLDAFHVVTQCHLHGVIPPNMHIVMEGKVDARNHLLQRVLPYAQTLWDESEHPCHWTHYAHQLPSTLVEYGTKLKTLEPGTVPRLPCTPQVESLSLFLEKGSEEAARQVTYYILNWAQTCPKLKHLTVDISDDGDNYTTQATDRYRMILNYRPSKELWGTWKNLKNIESLNIPWGLVTFNYLPHHVGIHLRELSISNGHSFWSDVHDWERLVKACPNVVNFTGNVRHMHIISLIFTHWRLERCALAEEDNIRATTDTFPPIPPSMRYLILPLMDRYYPEWKTILSHDNLRTFSYRKTEPFDEGEGMEWDNDLEAYMVRHPDLNLVVSRHAWVFISPMDVTDPDYNWNLPPEDDSNNESQ